MIYKAGNRFNEENYFLTEIDSSVPSCLVTGELDGEPVEFSGGGSITFATSHAVLSEKSTVISFENISHEPSFIALLVDKFGQNSADYTTYVGLFVKGGEIEVKRDFILSVGEYKTSNFSINTSFDNNVLSFSLSGPFRFFAGDGYTLIYGY